MNMPFDQNQISSGTQFEKEVLAYLMNLGFEGFLTGVKDQGVDIVANISLNGENTVFNIQCKYQNSTLGNHPIQEVYTGTAHRKNNGLPVVLTNNIMTSSAKTYAKNLDVEIISDVEWGILNSYLNGTRKTMRNTGRLLKTIAAIKTNNLSLITKSKDKRKDTVSDEEKKHREEIDRYKEEIQSKIDLLEKLTEEEESYHHKASECRRQHTRILKEFILSNLEYG